MNWTGGSLQRTRKGNGGIIQQQKAYFARARTHLQDVTNSPAAPFRPSYLHASGSDGLMGQLPLFGTQSIRHKGQTSKRSLQNLRAQSSDSQCKHRSEEISQKAHVSSHTRGPTNTAIEVAKGIVGGMSTIRLKRSITEADPEGQLLEANRKRLLKRPDWIGVYPSKPVSLPFVPFRDKHRIGKRRKTEIKPDETAGHGVTTNFADRQIQDAVLIERCQSGDLSNDPDYMRIRIGTDALTSAYSTQRHECGQSRDSSDPMLFEQHIPNAGTCEPLQLVRPVNHWPDGASSAFQQRHRAPSSISLTDNHNHQYSKLGGDMIKSSFPQSDEQANSEGEQIETPASHSHTIPSSAPGYRMTHCAGGGQQPLRLIFVDSDSSEDDDCHERTGDKSIRYSTKEQVHMNVPPFANAAQSGRMQHPERDDDRPSPEGFFASHTIDNVNAWESFSSHSVTAMESRNSNLHLYPTARKDNEAAATWSQLATQGDQTQPSSSVLSASLPSIRRGIGRRALTDASLPGGDDINAPARKQFQTPKEDEKLWQAFVFGSDKASSSSQMLHERGYQGILLNELGTMSCVSLSAAVSSLNAKPSNLSPSRFSCIEDSILQPAANVTPQSVPRERSSPVIQGMFEESSDDELSGDFVQRSVGLRDNASCDTSLDPASVLSGTRTVGRSLQHARSSSNTQAPASRLKSGQYHSSMQAIPGSDGSDNNLHLVDPELE
ncbi:hypothetical protein J1614_008773 [Plenodomus biglobosus]|nr:hypothetical protein J1614_008773 [Plenodomus biglobosus]